MTPSTKAHQLKNDFGELAEKVVDEKIKLLESLFDLGLKDIHLVLSTPVKPYIDVINPLIKELQEVKNELKKNK